MLGCYGDGTRPCCALNRYGDEGFSPVTCSVRTVVCGTDHDMFGADHDVFGKDRDVFGMDFDV